MKALTICQPYAHLIVLGDKRVENRTWSTNYRGHLYIHAGKSREWLDEDDLKQYPSISFGAVVAVATLVDCVLYSSVGKNDRVWSWLLDHPHASGPWCWVLDKVAAIGPWPYRGAQGLFDIQDAALDAIANRALGLAP